MATESKIHVIPSVQPEFAVADLSAETAELASSILSENHEKFHIYFNDAGFHSMYFFFFWTLCVASLRYLFHLHISEEILMEGIQCRSF